ncbi:hypothetical protein [Sphingomonas azotifigens]|uniref:hypothetical protein n=1 Tax=Sphingomonas azotifigens TaxID=330920 RepID=UPI000A0733CA|nr:hypothetical protein [Sphingomonas azotifigens]
MSAEADDAIDALLRRSFDGPVEDGGFTDRVMRTLPRRHRHGAWCSLVGMIAGAVSCWVTVGSSPIMLMAWQIWVSGRPSVSLLSLVLAVMGLSVLGLIWTISEAADDPRHVLT